MQNTYNKQTAKFLAMVAQNMPDLTSDVMQGWIENPKALKEALSVLCPPVVPPFPVWKTIHFDTRLRSADNFRFAFIAEGIWIMDHADYILRKVVFATDPKEIEVDLVVVSNAELGFKNGAKLEDTYARALELGLETCQPEDGLHLRLQYVDQPNGELLLIAMEPIVDSDDDQRLFGVKRSDDGKWCLVGIYSNPFRVLPANTQFVFRRPRK